MKKTRRSAVAAGVATLSLVAAAPGAYAQPGPPSATGTTSSTTTATTIKPGGVVHIAMPWASVPDDFNPLSPGGTATTAGGTGSAIYEPLMYVNPYTGRATPMLATSYAWSDGNRTLTVTVRPGVTWSDGQPFTAADVAYTFELLKKYPALDVNGLFRTGRLASVSVGPPGAGLSSSAQPTTAVFHFSAVHTAALPAILGQSIVPEHIWEKVADPVTFTNAKDPVGTGPFLLASYSKTKVTYKKNPRYWMPGRPYISGVVMTATKTVVAAELEFLVGTAAETDVAFTDPERTITATNPVNYMYWWPVVGVNLLYLNNARAPFNAVTVRKAVAEAIKTDQVAERAYFGAIPAADEAAVPGGLTSEWLPASVRALEWAQGPSKASALLAAHGYHMVDGHLQSPSGDVLPTFKILIGAGWTDFLSMAETISQQLSAIGVSSVIDQEPYPTYEADLHSGNFTMALSWASDGGGSPYDLYDQLLAGPAGTAASSLATTASPGTSSSAGATLAGGDWERYTSPSVSAALAAFNAKAGPAPQQAAMATIEKDLLETVPVVPLTGRPNFLDYSTRYFLGWPSAADPYNAAEAPDAFGGGAEQMFLNIHQY